METTHVKEIERLVEHLNEDWFNDNLKNVERYFHPNVVMIEPGTNRRISGVEEMIESYRVFMEDAEVSDFKIKEMSVDLFGSTAVAFYTYRVHYHVDNTKFDESNAEILVLRRDEDSWQIVWRTQLLGE